MRGVIIVSYCFLKRLSEVILKINTFSGGDKILIFSSKTELRMTQKPLSQIPLTSRRRVSLPFGKSHAQRKKNLKETGLAEGQTRFFEIFKQSRIQQGPLYYVS